MDDTGAVHTIIKNVSALRDVIVTVYKQVPDTSFNMISIVTVALTVLGVVALVVLAGRERVQETERSTPLSLVEIGPETSSAGTFIRILGATLLEDGRIEVRGEVVGSAKQSPSSSLQVGVKLDGEDEEVAVDANSWTWTAHFPPRNPPRPGARLSVVAILYGEGHSELDRVGAVLVEQPGAPS
jgi:heme/copper-type cytochrome/quinol oxidase subunit 2